MNKKEIQDQIAVLKDELARLEKIAARSEFWPGQHVIVNGDTPAIFLFSMSEHEHQVYCVDFGLRVVTKIQPDPDWTPPGYVKIHKHDGSSNRLSSCIIRY